MTTTRKSNDARDSKEIKDGPIKVFVVSPIGSTGTEPHRKAQYALEYLIRRALPMPKWEVHRADEGASPGSISHHVIDNIAKADLIVVDLTDHNPNVFYELAIAHGWKKPVVHIIEDGQKIPFDVIDQRTIPYDLTDLKSVSDAVDAITKAAEWAIAHNDELVTPMKQYEMFSVSTSNGNDPATVQTLQFEELIRRIGGLERALYHPARHQTLSEAKRASRMTQREAIDDFASRCMVFNDLIAGQKIGPDQVDEFDSLAENLLASWINFTKTEQQNISQSLNLRGIGLPAILG